MTVAQLIKFYDHISRYEINPFHYPTQFIHLKRENWRKLYDVWEEQRKEALLLDSMEEEKDDPWYHMFFKGRKQEGELEKEDDLSPNMMQLPQTETGLKHYFLDKLFHFQIKWATSTISQVSFTEKDLYHDEGLKYFL